MVYKATAFRNEIKNAPPIITLRGAEVEPESTTRDGNWWTLRFLPGTTPFSQVTLTQQLRDCGYVLYSFGRENLDTPEERVVVTCRKAGL